MSGAHPRHRLDDVIHAPVRLSVVAALAAVDRADFREVRDAVEVSDSVLSKAVATLEAAAYVDVTKGRVGRRPRTWLALTAAGRTALTDHLAALTAIAAGGALPDAVPDATPGTAPDASAGTSPDDVAATSSLAGARAGAGARRTAERQEV